MYSDVDVEDSHTWGFSDNCAEPVSLSPTNKLTVAAATDYAQDG